MNGSFKIFQNEVRLNQIILQLVIYENFPFGKELKNELKKIIDSDKQGIVFNNEVKILYYQETFYKEFYHFLFNIITDFKESEVLINRLIKDSLSEGLNKKKYLYSEYGKKVKQKFFKEFPFLKNQFIIKNPFKAIHTKTKKVLIKRTNNRLVDWYSTNEFQRLRMLIDIRTSNSKLKRNISKDIVDKIAIFRIELDNEYTKEFSTQLDIITFYFPQKESKEIYKYQNNYIKWKKNNPNILANEKSLFDEMKV